MALSYYILVVEIPNVHSMSRLEEIVFGKTGTRIAIALAILWIVGVIILSIMNIVTALK